MRSLVDDEMLAFIIGLTAFITCKPLVAKMKQLVPDYFSFGIKGYSANIT
jgi:hypothetical protein